MILAIGIAFDLVLHSRLDGFGGTLFVVTCTLGLACCGRIRNPQALVCAFLAVPFGALLALRENQVLFILNTAVALGLLLFAVSYAGGDSIVAVGFKGVVVRLARIVSCALMAPAFTMQNAAALVPVGNRAAKERLVAVARGAGLAVPVIAVLGLLLASGDAVFATVFRFPFDIATVTHHTWVLIAGCLGGAALLVSASQPSSKSEAVRMTSLGKIEVSVVLGAMVLLYGVFAGVQLIVARGGADHVLMTNGLTWAEYARQGYFQLLGAAAITLAVLVGLRAARSAAGERSSVSVVVLSEMVVGFTFVILGVALYRLGLYEEAFGSTVLRFFSAAGAWWLGVVFLLVGIAISGVAGDRRWLGGAVLATILVAVFVLDLVNPEAIIVRRNVAHLQAGKTFDDEYFYRLSEDAVPAMVDAIPTLAPSAAGSLLMRVCVGQYHERAGLSANIAGRRVAETRARVCQS